MLYNVEIFNNIIKSWSVIRSFNSLEDAINYHNFIKKNIYKNTLVRVICVLKI